jgi:hypothetical protein
MDSSHEERKVGASAGRIVKIFMRRASSSLGVRRGVVGIEPSLRALPAPYLWKGTVGRCLCPGDCVPRGTTQQRNTHIRDVREICYSWHPWHGRTVQVHANLVRRGRPVAYCSLEDVPTCRVLEVPLWMLDNGSAGQRRHATNSNICASSGTEKTYEPLPVTSKMQGSRFAQPKPASSQDLAVLH